MRHIPAQGLTFEQVSRIAIERGVHILIGCHRHNVGRTPPVISVQVQAADGKTEPVAFSFALHGQDPYLNGKLCHVLMDHIDRVKPGPRLLIVP